MPALPFAPRPLTLPQPYRCHNPPPPPTQPTKYEICNPNPLLHRASVKGKTCQDPFCLTLANYNAEGKRVGLYCNAHKEKGMVNVAMKKCLDPKCLTLPNYNTEGKKGGVFCSKHKKKGMVNVKDKTCQDPFCLTGPSYNAEGKRVGLYCKAHKEKGMVNVRAPSCKSVWCPTLVIAKYEGYCLFCFVHVFPNKPVARNYKTKELAVVEFVKKRRSTSMSRVEMRREGGRRLLEAAAGHAARLGLPGGRRRGRRERARWLQLREQAARGAVSGRRAPPACVHSVQPGRLHDYHHSVPSLRTMPP